MAPAAAPHVSGRRRAGRRASGSGSSVHERLAQREVQVHGARAAVERAASTRGRRACASSAAAPAWPRGRRPRRTTWPRRRKLDLVDRLPGADLAQLGRAVGGEHEQRHARLVRLDHGRQVVRPRRCPTCTRRATGRPLALARPEREERRRSARRRARSQRRRARRGRASARAASSASPARCRRRASRSAPARRRTRAAGGRCRSRCHLNGRPASESAQRRRRGRAMPRARMASAGDVGPAAWLRRHASYVGSRDRATRPATLPPARARPARPRPGGLRSRRDHLRRLRRGRARGEPAALRAVRLLDGRPDRPARRARARPTASIAWCSCRAARASRTTRRAGAAAPPTRARRPDGAGARSSASSSAGRSQRCSPATRREVRALAREDQRRNEPRPARGGAARRSAPARCRRCGAACPS